jgi:hypothetical protein
MWISLTPSAVSAMRPASWRAEIWRRRPSTSTGLRSRGMIAI